MLGLQRVNKPVSRDFITWEDARRLDVELTRQIIRYTNQETQTANKHVNLTITCRKVLKNNQAITCVHCKAFFDLQDMNDDRN